MDLLLYSLLALAVGPLLVVWAHRARATTIAIDAFSVTVIGGFVLLHVLPESVTQAGWIALLVALAGFLLPAVTERALRPETRGLRGTVAVLALLGMAVHATLDGMALAAPGAHDHGEPGHDHGAELLAWAVILHRLPVGVGVWWIVPRTLGVGVAVAILAVEVLGTLLGFSLGQEALTGTSVQAVGLFQALLGGSLLHVVLHAHVPPPPGHRQPRWHLASTFGALVAMFVLYFAIHDHFPEDAGQEPQSVFLSLALESAPALLVAFFAVGLCHALLPPGWLERVTRGRPFTQAVRGMAAGLPLPICSCGIVPIYRELVVKGASLAAAVAFLVATPELEIAAVLLTWQLMGPEIAVVRLLAAAVLAIGVALVMGALVRKVVEATSEPASCPPPAGRRSPRSVLATALRFGYGEAVDHTATWILLGLGLSAILVPYIDAEQMASLPRGLDVPLAALLGLPLYVCASGSTPLAAVLVAQGLSPGAALAFLLTGPATNVTTFGMLARLHGVRAATLFAVSMLLGATAVGYLVNGVLPTPTLPPILDPEHGHPLLQWICLVVMGLVFFVSLLRQGVRTFIERLFESPAYVQGHGAHSHGHAAGGGAARADSCGPMADEER